MSKEVMNRPAEVTSITTVEDILAKMREGVKAALDARDSTFGDYRTGDKS